MLIDFVIGPDSLKAVKDVGNIVLALGAYRYNKGIDKAQGSHKAVKEGNCWSTGSSMYQRTDIAGDMIMDFHTLFTEENPEDKLVYLSKLE